MTRSGSMRFVAGVVAGLLLSLTPVIALWRMSPDTVKAAGGGTSMSSTPLERSGVNVLVLGVDERPGQTGRSDTMMVVHFDNQQTRILSIPRDTRVHLEGHEESKINAAYAYGGVQLAKETVSSLLGLPIDYYVTVNFAGFRELVDLMGGVEYDVEKPMHYEDPTDGLVIDLQPGLQRLEGAKAEQYVRFRHDEIGEDMGRVQRQQAFLRAAAAQALTPANLPKLPRLLAAAQAYMKTDMPLSRSLSLAYSGYTTEQRGAIVQETLPGHSGTKDDISFFFVDPGQLQALIKVWQGQ